jgi:hypothetical protein
MNLCHVHLILPNSGQKLFKKNLAAKNIYIDLQYKETRCIKNQ